MANSVLQPSMHCNNPNGHQYSGADCEKWLRNFRTSINRCEEHLDRKQREGLKYGRERQLVMIQNEYAAKPILFDQLIRLFASCGCLVEANQLFDKNPQPSIYTWNAIILAHFNFGLGQAALDLYHRTQLAVNSNQYIYVPVIKTCSMNLGICQGRQIHEKIIQDGLQYDVFVGTALLDMYAKCGSLVEAHNAFAVLPERDGVSWGALIFGYAQQDEGFLALIYFEKMQRYGVKLNRVAVLGSLRACAIMNAAEQGKGIHEQIIGTELEFDVLVGSALVDMYVKCGSFEAACRTFDKLKNRNVVSWGAILAGCAQYGEGVLALQLYVDMQHEGIKPNEITFSSILKACGSMGIIWGRHVHQQIFSSCIQLDIVVQNSLVDMYVRCGSMEEALSAFLNLSIPDIISWNAMINGYAQLGDVLLAAAFLEGMQSNKIKPDDMTFTGILSVCSRAGLVDEGRKYFKSMTCCHGIMPNEVHYNCMIDLLSRAGYLQEAEDLLNAMMEPNVRDWATLLKNLCDKLQEVVWKLQLLKFT